jgi:hypothetical protein
MIKPHRLRLLDYRMHDQGCERTVFLSDCILSACATAAAIGRRNRNYSVHAVKIDKEDGALLLSWNWLHHRC